MSRAADECLLLVSPRLTAAHFLQHWATMHGNGAASQQQPKQKLVALAGVCVAVLSAMIVLLFIGTAFSYQRLRCGPCVGTDWVQSRCRQGIQTTLRQLGLSRDLTLGFLNDRWEKR